MKLPKLFEYIPSKFRRLFIVISVGFVTYWIYSADYYYQGYYIFWTYHYYIFSPKDKILIPVLIAIPLFFWAVKPIIKGASKKNKEITVIVLLVIYLLSCIMITKHLIDRKSLKEIDDKPLKEFNYY